MKCHFLFEEMFQFIFFFPHFFHNIGPKHTSGSFGQVVVIYSQTQGDPRSNGTSAFFSIRFSIIDILRLLRVQWCEVYFLSCYFYHLTICSTHMFSFDVSVLTFLPAPPGLCCRKRLLAPKQRSVFMEVCAVSPPAHLLSSVTYFCSFKYHL